MADDNGTSFDLAAGNNFLACFDSYGTCAPNITLTATGFPVYDSSVTSQPTTTQTTIQQTGFTGPDDPRWTGAELTPSGFTWTQSNQYVRGYGMYRNGSQSLELVAMIYFNTTRLVDTTPPDISITAPLDGSSFAVNQVVPAQYACTDSSGVQACTGTVAAGSPIDTSTPGAHSFSVTATDTLGNSVTRGVEYTVGVVASVGDAHVTEGNSGSTALVFPVTLSGPSTKVVKLNYNTVDGTATAGSDYTAKTGVLTIPAGVTSGSIPVTVRGDTLVEGDETLGLSLTAVSPPTATSLGRSAAMGTISDDDTASTVSVADAAGPEGDSGFTQLVFPVTLDTPAEVAIKLTYVTASGTATAGSDYSSKSGTLTIAAGATSSSISVPVRGDKVPEGDETLLVKITRVSAGNGVPGRTTAIGTIVDDDVTAAVSVQGASITEGNSGRTPLTFQVSLDRPVATAVKVSYSTSDGTASAPADYITKSGSVTIPAGSTSALIPVNVVGDRVAEPNETFEMDLTGVSGPATIVGGAGIATIVDDD